MGKSMPDGEDYGKVAADAVYADLNMLPLRRWIEAAARKGEKGVDPSGTPQDFTGLGDADVAGQYADQMAGVLLDLQQTYGDDYVKQRLAELQAADPEGQTARKQLYASLQTGLKDLGAQAGAVELEKSQLADLEQGATLDPAMRRQVGQAVRGGQVDRGNYLGNAAVAQEAGATANASETLRAQRQQKALAYLQSGVSPEDVSYRKTQQAAADLGSFINGVTPTAQFAGVSSAGNGAAPFVSTGPMTTTTNPNAATQGAGNALAIYQGNLNWAQNQANPYMAGASIGAGAYGVYQAARP